MKHLTATVILALVCTSNTAFPAQQTDKRLEQLQRERDRLNKSRDPVDHTKAQIAISEILLTFVADAVRKGDLDEMEKQLGEYCAAIQDADKTIMSTGRDANRHPAGFKDLEIALRRQMSRLEGFAQALNYDQREPVKKAKADALAIHDHLIKAILLEDKNAKAAEP